jgi:monoterpene epsilon-lactone hydrolase
MTHVTTPAAESPLTSLKRWASVQAYGLFARTCFGANTAPQVLRQRFERFAVRSRADMLRRFPAIRFDDYPVGALRMESLCAVRRPRCALIHLHGGGFVFGSSASYRDRARRFSFRFDAEVFLPDYRLAPEHPFPAALEDALVAYQYVRALRPDLPILLSGDSAGGGLALSLLVRLRDLRERMPQGAVLLSPWTDLSASGVSLDRNEASDAWLSRAHLERWASCYVGRNNPRHPLLSPAFAELHALPPLLLLAGEHEVLLDDSLRVVDAAMSAGTQASVHVGPRMQHDWPITLPWLAESRQAWNVMGSFAAARCDEFGLPQRHGSIAADSFAHRATPSPTGAGRAPGVSIPSEYVQ